VRITYTHHAQRRMRERAVSAADVRRVLANRPPQRSFPSPRKRSERGRASSGALLEVVYTEEKAGEFRIVTVITPDR
jgi:hypothetical protein